MGHCRFLTPLTASRCADGGGRRMPTPLNVDWHFHQIQPGDPVGEPMQGGFFHQDVISDSAIRGIVREGIQNALDAKSDAPVTVRIALMRGEHACSPSLASHIFPSKMWDHIMAQDNGLRPDMLPERESVCDYLLFEDFGTTGLTGKIEQYVRERGKGSNFFHFFRATGSTDKRGNKLGKWGIGKHTFWMASRINTVFGFSVRESVQDPCILMGKTILNSHAIGESPYADYQDGYYGRPADNSKMVLPLVEDEQLSKFRQAFSLRRTNEPGLSLVVPWVRDKIRDTSKEKLISEVAADYFYPILAGQLIVHVTVGSDEVVLSAENIDDNVSDINTGRLIRLARWMKTADLERHEIEPTSPLSKPEWSSDMFSPELLDELRDAFNNGREITLRVSVTVTPKGTTESNSQNKSHFDIALVQEDDDGGTGNPCFIRGGIRIPRVKASPVAKNITALVVAEDGELANFLGAGENPSHTEWQQSLLTDKYKNVGKMLSFVSNSVHHTVRIIAQSDEIEDNKILADIFPMPEDIGGDPDVPDPNPDPYPPSPSPVPKPNPSKFVIEKIKDEGGFSVHDNPQHPLTPGAILTIRAAYSIRKSVSGSLKRYTQDDFLLQNLAREDSGVEILDIDNNMVRAKITNADFHLRLTGFDKNRDVVVRAQVEEV